MSCAINSDFTNFGFDKTVSAFVLWFSGLSLAVCFLLGEMVRRRYSGKHKITLNQFRIETATAHSKQNEIHAAKPIYTDELDASMTKMN